jgi:predicted Zn-dependent peptidase
MESVKFKNGFEYLLLNNNSKLCCVQFKLNIGSKDDPVGKNGLAHVTEHMLYDNNIDTRLDNLGVQWNAYTTRDSTGYTFICTKSKINVVIKIIKTMMFHMKFRNSFFTKEKNVVIEEILLKNSQRPHRLRDLVYKTMFSSKYKNSIKGTLKTVKNININDVVQFYKKWYVPNNIKLVCIGNFNHSLVSQSLTKINTIPRKKSIKPFCFTHKEIYSQLTHINKTFNSELVNISCNSIIPGNDIITNSIFDIISLNLQTNLYAILREKHGLSYNPYCSYSIYKDFGVIELSATVKKANIKKSLKIINNILKSSVLKSKLQNLRENALITNNILYESIESQSTFYCDEMFKLNKVINSIEEYDEVLQNIPLKLINIHNKKLKFITVMN